MSREKIFNLKAMGAEVILTRSDVAKGHPEYYQDLAARIADETPGAFFINQFGNPDNPRAHEEDTGPEIWRSEEHTSELQSLMRISYAVFCLKKKTIQYKKATSNTSNSN